MQGRSVIFKGSLYLLVGHPAVSGTSWGGLERLMMASRPSLKNSIRAIEVITLLLSKPKRRLETKKVHRVGHEKDLRGTQQNMHGWVAVFIPQEVELEYYEG